MAITHQISVSWANPQGGTGVPAKTINVSGNAEANLDGFIASGVTNLPYALPSGQCQSLFVYSDQPVFWQLNLSGGAGVSGGYSFNIPAGGVTLFTSGGIGTQPFSGAVLNSWATVSGLPSTASGANFSVRTNLI